MKEREQANAKKNKITISQLKAKHNIPERRRLKKKREKTLN